MAKHLLHLTAFVASPSDVFEERETLESTVRELNQTWVHEVGAQLDLVRWETHAYPDSGEDAQTVINRQLGDDYDIFIGILWHRFGTPTPRADSGTAEEFERARLRYEEDPDALGIMFYFKTTPPPSLGDIDPSQLAKVNKFKALLGTEGHLYWDFSGNEDFSRFLRLHLPRQIRARVEQLKKTKSNDDSSEDLPRNPDSKPSLDRGTSALAKIEAAQEIAPNQQPEDDEEEGLFDLYEKYEDNVETSRQILERIAAEITALGERVKERTSLLESEKDEHGKVAPKKAKSIINQVAVDMEQFSTGIEAELPLYSKHQLATFDSLSKAILIQKEFTETEGTSELIEMLLNLKEIMATTAEQISGFRESISTQKKFTIVFNRAKRRAVKNIDVLLGEIDTGTKLITESLKALGENDAH